MPQTCTLVVPTTELESLSPGMLYLCEFLRAAVLLTSWHHKTTWTDSFPVLKDGH